MIVNLKTRIFADFRGCVIEIYTVYSMYIIWVIMMNLKVRGINFTCLSVYSEIFLYTCPSYHMTEQLPVQLIALRSSFVILQVSPRAERKLISEKFIFIARES